VECRIGFTRFRLFDSGSKRQADFFRRAPIDGRYLWRWNWTPEHAFQTALPLSLSLGWGSRRLILRGRGQGN
jgi:hypothetical protein